LKENGAFSMFIYRSQTEQANQECLTFRDLYRGFIAWFHTVQEQRCRHHRHITKFSPKFQALFENLWIELVGKKIAERKVFTKLFLKIFEFFIEIDGRNVLTRSFSNWFFIFQNDLLQLFREASLRLTKFSEEKLLYRLREGYVHSFLIHVFRSKVVCHHKLRHIAHYF